MSAEYKEYFERVSESQSVPEYAAEYFDHLYNEFLSIPPEQVSYEIASRASEWLRKREEKKLRWSDVYGFDLLLVELLPFRDLVRKAYDMRAKYRSVAGQRDYDAYIASRPPDLTLPADLDKTDSQSSPAQPPPTPPITSPPDLPLSSLGALTLESLRADIRYLLGQFYLYYALLPYREGFRDEITRRARNLTFIFLGVFAVILFLTSIEAKSFRGQSLRVPTILVVVLTGVIGGCVSMLQRIQSAPAEGDAIFNLASLTNGWKGMSLSPLYGAIFAVIFYMLFASGVVKGVVFPTIQTPETFVPKQQEQQQQQAAPVTQQEQAATSGAASVERPPSIFWTFTDGTYPTSGTAYALLIIWSFLAGFLERLVPDALNRLATKTQLIEGTTT